MLSVRATREGMYTRNKSMLNNVGDYSIWIKIKTEFLRVFKSDNVFQFSNLCVSILRHKEYPLPPGSNIFSAIYSLFKRVLLLCKVATFK